MHFDNFSAVELANGQRGFSKGTAAPLCVADPKFLQRAGQMSVLMAKRYSYNNS